MTRLIATFWLLAAGIAALGLFQIKHQVQGLEQALRIERQAILAAQESIHVLQAEWSFLNRPAVIARLAADHLGLAPLAAEQFVSFEQLPSPSEPGAESGPALPQGAIPLLASAETGQ